MEARGADSMEGTSTVPSDGMRHQLHVTPFVASERSVRSDGRNPVRSVLAPNSKARSPSSFLLLLVMASNLIDQ